MIAIDRMTPGSPPAGFSFARTGQGSEGKWTVTEDRTAAAGKVIEQISTDRTDYRFPLAIHESLSAANVDVEVRFKAVAGKTDQAGGIAVRLTDADNYYVARANALEDNVRFYRVVAGRREQLEGANLRVSPMNGIRSACARKASASRSPSTARNYSARRTRLLPRQAAWRCGPSPTA